MKRKICVITGSRAEYGLLRWLMKEINKSLDFELQLLVTGSHLFSHAGYTVDEILLDGFTINAKVEIPKTDDSYESIAYSVGIGVSRISVTLMELCPDLVVVLGDRYEILAAAQASMLLHIPIAHLHGGEVTNGSLDDRMRHAITKLSDLHFVATEEYRKRVIQLGEHPQKVFNVGAPGLDALSNIEFIDKNQIGKQINFKIQDKLLLVTYHPDTSGLMKSKTEFSGILRSLDAFEEYQVILTKPNQDAGGLEIANMAKTWEMNKENRVKVVDSLGQSLYLNTLRHCDAVVGNSSSGLVEAPALRIPTLNIGNRQSGRLKAQSVLDVESDLESIIAGLKTVLSEEFRAQIKNSVSLYGGPGASAKILKVLQTTKTSDFRKAPFYDLQF